MIRLTLAVLVFPARFALKAVTVIAKVAVFLVLLGFLSAAHAESDEEWGCKVLMCLANTKGGPKAHHDCIDPIDRLYNEVLRPPRGKKPRPFPRCSSAGGGNGTQMGSNYFDPCPEGTQALTEGTRATQLSATEFQIVRAGRASLDLNAIVVGIGEGENVGGRLSGAGGARKFCVANHVGNITVGNQEESYTVAAFERMVMLDPATSPNYIDVFIGNQKHTRVRY